jgi:hypothetical protein
VVNQGPASRSLNVLADHRAAISCIHQFVASIDPLGTDACER